MKVGISSLHLMSQSTSSVVAVRLKEDWNSNMKYFIMEKVDSKPTPHPLPIMQSWNNIMAHFTNTISLHTRSHGGSDIS